MGFLQTSPHYLLLKKTGRWRGAAEESRSACPECPTTQDYNGLLYAPWAASTGVFLKGMVIPQWFTFQIYWKEFEKMAQDDPQQISCCHAPHFDHAAYDTICLGKHWLGRLFASPMPSQTSSFGLGIWENCLAMIHGQFQVENLKHPTHLSGFRGWFSVAYHIPVYKWSSIIMLQLDLAMVVIQSRQTYAASKSVGFSHVFYQASLGMILQGAFRCMSIDGWQLRRPKVRPQNPSDIQLSHNQPMIWVVCTAWASHAKVGRTSISALCPWWGYLIWASRFLFYRLLCSLLFVWRGLLKFFWTPHQPQFSRAE